MTPSVQNYIKTEEHFGANCYRSVPIVFERGEGAYLWDVNGKRYLDIMSAYSAVSLGHTHPRVTKALAEQASRLSMISRAFHSDQLGPALQAITAFFGYERCLFMNSGAEAVDTAIKIARRWGYTKKKIEQGQAEIIVMENNFHGRSLMLSGLSTNSLYKENYGPFIQGFKTVPFGDIEALEKAITFNTCAVLLEPIQGEAGVIVPPSGWLQNVRNMCSQHNILLVADEVQSGLGRSGHPLYSSSQNARADIVTLGKSLGGGVIPVSAVLADDCVMSVLTPGSHGSTFGGNPLASRMVQEVISIMNDEKLSQKSQELGSKWIRDLQSLSLRNAKEIRGAGLWVGIEMNPEVPHINDWTHQKVMEMAEEGLLVKETRGRILRLAPPLVISVDQLNEATSIIQKVLS